MSLSNLRFAQMAARIGKAATSWAGDTLDCDLNEPVSESTLKRFREEIIFRLDFIEETSQEPVVLPLPDSEEG